MATRRNAKKGRGLIFTKNKKSGKGKALSVVQKEEGLKRREEDHNKENRTTTRGRLPL